MGSNPQLRIKFASPNFTFSDGVIKIYVIGDSPGRKSEIASIGAPISSKFLPSGDDGGDGVNSKGFEAKGELSVTH